MGGRYSTGNNRELGYMYEAIQHYNQQYFHILNHNVICLAGSCPDILCAGVVIKGLNQEGTSILMAVSIVQRGFYHFPPDGQIAQDTLTVFCMNY